MSLPQQPVTLTTKQIEELNRKLGDLRHNVNNQLSLIVAGAELIRQNPQSAERVVNTLAAQPAKIMAEVGKFSAEFERVFDITHPGATT